MASVVALMLGSCIAVAGQAEASTLTSGDLVQIEPPQTPGTTLFANPETTVTVVTQSAGYVEFQGGDAASGFTVTFDARPAGQFAPGIYTQSPSSNVGYVDPELAGAPACAPQGGSSFHVFDVSYDSGGNISTFAAQFSAVCEGFTRDGYISYQSSVAMPTWLVASPPSMDFGSVSLGVQSPFQTETLANLGSDTTISAINLTGPGENDYDGTTTCFETLAIGTTCSYTVGFIPGAPGDRPATLTPVAGNGATAPTLTVGGTGAAGYYTVDSRGYLGTFGDAGYYGDGYSTFVPQPVISIANMPHNYGYWLLSANGVISAFGNAQSHGNLPAHLNAPALGIAGTPDGNGYWVVAQDGGVFTFGDAGFYGSTGSIRLNKPVVGMAPTPDGRGYWLVAADGGIFNFGDAGFYGSTGSIRLNEPIVGMTPTWDGQGYWFVANDGGIFNFGDAPFYGSDVGPGEYGVVGMAGSMSPTYQAMADGPA